MTSNDSSMSMIKLVAEFASVMGLIVSFTILIFSWPELPLDIPCYFHLSFQADTLCDRTSAIILPGLALVFYIGFSALTMNIHRFREVWGIEGEQLDLQYEYAKVSMILIKMELVWLFAYREWQIIMKAMEKPIGVGALFTPLLLILIFLSLIFFTYQIHRLHRARA